MKYLPLIFLLMSLCLCTHSRQSASSRHQVSAKTGIDPLLWRAHWKFL